MATSEVELTLCLHPFLLNMGALGTFQGFAYVLNMCYVGEGSQWGEGRWHPGFPHRKVSCGKTGTLESQGPEYDRN